MHSCGLSDVRHYQKLRKLWCPHNRSCTCFLCRMALITDLSASTTIPQPFQLVPLWSQHMMPQPTLCVALWLPIYGRGVSLGVSVWVWVSGCVGGWCQLLPSMAHGASRSTANFFFDNINPTKVITAATDAAPWLQGTRGWHQRELQRLVHHNTSKLDRADQAHADKLWILQHDMLETHTSGSRSHPAPSV